MTGAVLAAPNAQWLIYQPPGADGLRPEASLLPCPTTDDPQSAEQLVIVIAAAADLAAAREVILQKPGQTVVLWAWWLPEVLAVEAEYLAPTVYGAPLMEDFEAARDRGPGASEKTQLLAACEQAFGFDPAASMPVL